MFKMLGGYLDAKREVAVEEVFLREYGQDVRKLCYETLGPGSFSQLIETQAQILNNHGKFLGIARGIAQVLQEEGVVLKNLR